MPSLRLLPILSSLLLAPLLPACSGGGGGGGGGGGPATGSVGVLITDAPADAFSRIFVTVSRIELLGPVGVDLFSGTATFDLLELENASNPFALAADVPVGPYEKVRLHLTDLVLEREIDDGMGGVIVEEIRPPLPANGKIDLNPRGTIFVTPGELLLLEIDLDANKSIKVVGQGNGGYRFRPVVFIRVVNDPQDMDKLSRVFGTIDAFVGPDTFVLCSPGFMVMGAGASTLGCLRVNLFSDTSVFDANGDPAGTGDLAVGDPVTVPGTLRVIDREVELDAIVVEIGPFGTFPRVAGVVATPVDAMERFDFDVDAGQGMLPATLAAQLQPGTALVTREGFSIAPGAIDMDVPVEVDGVLRPDAVTPTEIAAALVIVEPPEFDEMRVSGTIDMLDLTTRSFDLVDASDTVCVDVPVGTTVLLVSDGGAIATSTPGALSDLSDGWTADVFGELVGPCVEADAVISFAP